MFERIKGLSTQKDKKYLLISFLANRCDAEFLRLFVEGTQGFLSGLRPVSWGIYSTNVKLFRILHTNQLLPEAERKRFIRELEKRVLWQPEWRVMQNAENRRLFKAGEYRSLRAKVRRQVTARRLKAQNQQWKDWWMKEKNQDPRSFFFEWEQELLGFYREFSNNQAIMKRFLNAYYRLQKIQAELKQDWQANEKSGEIEAAAESRDIGCARSIFDDVDT